AKALLAVAPKSATVHTAVVMVAFRSIVSPLLPDVSNPSGLHAWAISLSSEPQHLHSSCCDDRSVWHVRLRTNVSSFDVLLPDRLNLCSALKAERPERSVTEDVLTIELGTSGPKVALFTFDGVFVEGDFTPVALNMLADGGV